MKRIMSGIADKIASVKKQASRRISKKFPIWKQLNMLMAGLLIANKKIDACLVALDIDPLTLEDKTMEAQLVAVSSAIKAQRDRSDEIEVLISNHAAVDESDNTIWPSI